LVLPPAWAGSVDNPEIIRAAHPREIHRLPQIENAADRGFCGSGGSSGVIKQGSEAKYPCDQFVIRNCIVGELPCKKP
jgi:hypothetical protein